MSDGRKPKLKEQDADLPRMKVELKEEPPLTAAQHYLKRKAEVTQQDNEDFSEYLRKRPLAMNSNRRNPPPPRSPHRRGGEPRAGSTAGAC
jgi:hypothetical protein